MMESQYPIIIPEACSGVLRRQFTQIQFVQEITEQQLKIVESYITDSTKTVLDLGCGVGRVTAMIGQKYPDLHYYLADYNKLDKKDKDTRWLWNSAKDYKGVIYNDLSYTKLMMEANNIQNYTIIDLSKEPLPKVDLLFSFYAVGFHYPIAEQYDASIQIFQVRMGDDRPDGEFINFLEYNRKSLKNQPYKSRIWIRKQ